MKKFFSFLFLICFVSIIYVYRNDITKYIVYNYIYKKNIEIPVSNNYVRDYNFELIQNTDNFYPENRQDLYNVFYTILNNGYTDFTFYCGKHYSDCSYDVRQITNKNSQILSSINNYVHPYNSYNSISININNLGRINVKVEKLYSSEDIGKIDAEVNKIYNSIIKPGMTDEQKIKTFHDYIINHTTYDKTWIDTKNRTSKANTAYGPLFNKVALCGGYTDLMEIFLDKANIKSIKIASDNHIWNYVFINNEWKHIDLTWDDPITNTGKNVLQYDYYLLNTKQLEDKKDNEHFYSKQMYLEAK